MLTFTVVQWSFSCFCPCNRSQWCPKQVRPHWRLLYRLYRQKTLKTFLNVIYCVKMCWLLPLFSEVLTFFVHIKVNRAQNNISSTLTFIVPKKKGPSCVKVRPYLPIFSKFLQAKSSHFNRNPWDHIKGIIFPHTRFQLQIVHMDFHIDQQKAVWFESDFVWTMIHTLLHYCQNTFFATKFYKEESKA